MNFKQTTIGLAAAALVVVGCGVSEQGGSASAGEKVYAEFPVTVKGYNGSKTTSDPSFQVICRQN